MLNYSLFRIRPAIGLSSTCRQAVTWAGSAALALNLVGCANWNSVFHNQTVVDTPSGRQSIVTTDAKQRAIHYVQYGTGSQAVWRLCAEQAPDIFSVLSASASGELTVQPAEKEFAARVAAAAAESGGAIERSQTVNLLGMSMYRTCERFLNGQISGVELSLQAARDQRVMVSVLAIEQLTNIARPRGMRTSALGGGSAGGTAADYVNTIATAWTQVAAAEKAKEAAHAAYVEALGKASPPTGKAPDCTQIASEADQKDCKDKGKTLEQKTAAAKDVREYYETIKKQGDAAQMTARGARPDSVALTDANATLSAEAIHNIADTVFRLAALGAGVDYQNEACLLAQVRSMEKSPDPVSSPPVNWQKTFCGNSAIDDNRGTLVSQGEHDGKGRAGKSENWSFPNLNNRILWPVIIYPQVATNLQRTSLDELLVSLGERVNNITFYKTETIPSYKGRNVLRYFLRSDKEKCEAVADILTNNLKDSIECIYVSGYESKVGMGQMEIWLGPKTSIPK